MDFLIENSLFDVVGIEVKAATTVYSHDFAGLKRLESDCDARFEKGILLYDGTNTMAFGDRLTDLPLSALWS